MAQSLDLADPQVRWRAAYHPPVSPASRPGGTVRPVRFTVRSVRRMTLTQQAIYALLVVIGLGVTAVFALEWFESRNVPHRFSGALHGLDILEFAAVSWIVWHQILMQFFLWLVANTIKRPLSMTPHPGYRVAFISTFVPGAESVDLLPRNLPAMVAVDYPHDTWLLDEGGSAEVQAICRSYGVRYFTRSGIPKYNTSSGRFAARTKGGNHNAWYDMHGSSYDLVAQIDTDFTPGSNFLTRTLGYFNDPDVAFVGTPQVYGNIAGSSVARGAAQKQFTFYGPIMQGMSGVDSALMIGANHVVRVAALREIGFYAGHITEDLLTGMTIHAGKWKSVYVPETLAVGEGPTTWGAYFNQQMRWAYGCIDIFFHHSRRLLPRMGLGRLLRYLILQQYYFSGLSLGLGVVLLLFYFSTGHAPSEISTRGMLEFYLPVLLWQVLISFWLQQFNVDPATQRGPFLQGSIVSLAVIPIYMLAFGCVVLRRRLAFQVTPKGDASSATEDSLRVFASHLVLGSVTVAGIGTGVVLRHTAPMLMAWAGLTAATMYGVVGVAVAERLVGRRAALIEHRALEVRRRTASLAVARHVPIPASAPLMVATTAFGPHRRRGRPRVAENRRRGRPGLGPRHQPAPAPLLDLSVDVDGVIAFSDASHSRPRSGSAPAVPSAIGNRP